LLSVESNCVNEYGYSIAGEVRYEWIKANGADSDGCVLVGKMDDEAARVWLESTASSLTESYDELYKGLLHDDGYIIYHFFMYSLQGGMFENFKIKITNSGAEIIEWNTMR
jgi:hypothetical protein